MRSALLILASSLVLAGQTPKAVFPKDSFVFGPVSQGVVVEPEFVIRNEGSAPLLAPKVAITPPMTVVRLPREIAPGAEDRLRLRLDTAGIGGLYEGQVVVLFSDGSTPEVQLTVEGEITPSIELAPRAVLVAVADRGQAKETSLEIISHQEAPLRIEQVKHATDRFTTRLETLEDGKRYRLTLSLKPNGPGGRHADNIEVATSSAKMPLLRIPAYTYLRERVYTFPDSVDLGVWPLSSTAKNSTMADQVAQTLMIYQRGGSDFQVHLTTDLPLHLLAVRGPAGDRYQVTIRPDVDKLRAGRIQGTIVVETNDTSFPKLRVPVSGTILNR